MDRRTHEYTTCRIGEKNSFGTGIFVAPKKIITCYHVIEGLDKIDINFPFSDPLTIVTVNFETIKYFPRPVDLALIDLTAYEIPAYEIASLSTEININDKFLALGFTQLNFGADYFTGEFEGYVKRDNYEYIKIKGGQITPGFSGGGLMNNATNNICGIVRTSRDVNMDIGGYAIPVHTLFKAFPEIETYQDSDEHRNTSWYKFGLRQQHSFVNNFNEICRQKLLEQIIATGQNKYSPELYTTRSVEQFVKEYVSFEETYTSQIEIIVQQLLQIRQHYNINLSSKQVDDLRKVTALFSSPNIYHVFIENLKKAFHYDNIKQAIELFNDTIQTEDWTKYTSKVIKSKVFLEAKLTEITANYRLDALLFQARQMVLTNNNNIDTSSGSYQDMISVLPSVRHAKNVILANDLINQLDAFFFLQQKRCFAIVGKAGHGKTNILCHLSTQIAKTYPTLLLNGQMSINTEYDIEFHIEKIIKEYTNNNVSNWINELNNHLEKERSWLFIILDGINENQDIISIKKCISDFLRRIEDKRIKMIVSCRDIFWELFENELKSFLFKTPLTLTQYSDFEWTNAEKSYFSSFHIKGQFSEGAAKSLRNPLLLNFFCVINKNSDVGFVQDVRILMLFQHYLDKLHSSFSAQSSHVGKYSAVKDFLFQIGEQILKNGDTIVSLDNLNINYKDTSSLDYKLYVFLKSENILFEEEYLQNELVLKFVYDEFLEFIIALTWEKKFGSNRSEAAAKSFLDDAVKNIDRFRPTFGSLIILDALLNLNGKLVISLLLQIDTMHPHWLDERQDMIIYALEHICFSQADDRIISFIIKFEKLARDKVREQLSGIILKLFSLNVENHKLIGLVKNIIGLRAEGTRKANDYTTDGNINYHFTNRLPPKTFKYSIQSKLNAISLLAANTTVDNVQLIQAGILELGNIELHDSLESLISIDLASDDIIFSVVEQNLKEYLPEFRIYSAWLIRNRYGLKPAKHLTTLLCDKEYRVHKFTLKLFNNRLIERELISMILIKLADSTLKNWHVSNYLEILGKPEKFNFGEDTNTQIPGVINILQKYCNSSSSLIRFTALKALLKYPRHFSTEHVVKMLTNDKDPYIQHLINNFSEWH